MKSDGTIPLHHDNFNILLADDDQDDCLIFKEALEESALLATIKMVHNGEVLMQLLTKNPYNNFDVLFLDLNMPRKNGFTCLEEIKKHPQLKHLPVIILSTSFDKAVAEMLYKKGATYYICKPGNFEKYKKVILKAITLVQLRNSSQIPYEQFVLSNLNKILF